MPEKLSARMDRVERLIEVFPAKQAKLDELYALLIEAQIKTEERFRETDELFRRSDVRFRETGERIDKMLSANDEMLRRQNDI